MEQTIERHADQARVGSAASWPAIIAGAFVAMSVSLILLSLGSALGFAAVSPWPGRGVSPTTFAVTTAIWLIVMQWVSSAVGGYLTGRLRTRWVGTHTHEVFFRDTAHGLVTWAVATIVVATVVATSTFSAIGGTVHAAAGVASAGAASAGAATAAHEAMPGMGMGGSSRNPSQSGMGGQGENPYNVDKLFRPAGSGGGSGANGQGSGDPRIEVGHIVANAWTTGAVPDADRSYLAELVASRTGLSQAEAQRRVDEFIGDTMNAVTKAKADADAARKVAAETAIYTALSMLVGAFIASVSAAIGGRLRDEHL